MLKNALVLVCLGGLLLVGTAQQRTKKKVVADFGKTIEQVKKNWEAENYGACFKDLQACMNLVVKKRTEVIRASLPAAPQGWKARVDKNAEAAENNPMAAALRASVGNVIERKYDQVEGNGHLEVSVTADSPMVQMLAMMFTNPAAAGANAEAIGYGDHKGLLKNENNSLNLQILIANAHVVEVRMRIPKGMENDAAEDFLFQLFDQAAVDRMAAALSK